MPKRSPHTKRVAKSTDGITPKQALFIDEFVKHGDGKKAAMKLGVSDKSAGPMAATWLSPDHYPLVAQEVKDKMAALEERSMLTAEYTRRFMYDVLSVNLLNYFEPGENGAWELTMSAVKSLPPEVAVLIESFEQVTINLKGGGQIKKLLVKLISKTAALALAARYTLVAKHSIQASPQMVDFMELAKRAAEKKAAKEIEARISGVSVLTPVKEQSDASQAGGSSDHAGSVP